MTGSPPTTGGQTTSTHDKTCADRIRTRELLHAGDPTDPDPTLLHLIARTIHGHCGHHPLKAHRLAWGWSTAQAVAAFHGMCQREDLGRRGLVERSWHEWEAGTKRPDHDYLDRLARLFHSNVIQLGYATDHMPEAPAAILGWPTAPARLIGTVSDSARGVKPLIDLYCLVLEHLWRGVLGSAPERAAAANRDLVTSLSLMRDKGRLPGPDAIQRLDDALGADGLLVKLGQVIEEEARHGVHDRAGADQAEASVRRRTVLQQAMAALAAGTVGASAALEAIRGELTQTLARHADVQREVENWSEVAWDYGEAYLTLPPQVLVVDIAADLAAIEQWIDEERDRTEVAALSRVTAQLATLMAMSLVNLGQPRGARRWWQTARQAADASADREIRAWVRSEEAIRALYTRRGPQAAIELADEALAIGGRGNVGKALAGKAQALALMGCPAQARDVVRLIEPALENMPDGVVEDDHTVFGWPEHCLRHTESFVYSHIGDVAAAGDAQQRALALYPPTERRARALVQLHEAMCLVSAGHIDEGSEHAMQAVAALPASHRTTLVQQVGRRVISTVPYRERARSSVTGLFEVLALPPGGAAGNG